MQELLTIFETRKEPDTFTSIRQHHPERRGTPIDFQSAISAWGYAAFMTIIAKSSSHRIHGLISSPDDCKHRRKRLRRRRRQSGNTIIRQIHDTIHLINRSPMFPGRNEWITTLESSSPERHTADDESIDLFHFHTLIKTTPMILAQIASYRDFLASYFSCIGSIHLERCNLMDISHIQEYLHKPDSTASALAEQSFPRSRSKTFFRTAIQPPGTHRTVLAASWQESHELMRFDVERFRTPVNTL